MRQVWISVPSANWSLTDPPDTDTLPGSPSLTAVAFPTQGIEIVPLLDWFLRDPRRRSSGRCATSSSTGSMSWS
jgi:hypothetical protein